LGRTKPNVNGIRGGESDAKKCEGRNPTTEKKSPVDERVKEKWMRDFRRGRIEHWRLMKLKTDGGLSAKDGAGGPPEEDLAREGVLKPKGENLRA